jgi:hypothetical protein
MSAQSISCGLKFWDNNDWFDVGQQKMVGNIPTIFLKNLTKSLQIQLR